MPHGNSVRQALNEDEVHSALCAATHGYGNTVRFARRIGVSREYIRGMIYGGRRISVEVAGLLGYELRWVKKRKEKC